MLFLQLSGAAWEAHAAASTGMQVRLLHHRQSTTAIPRSRAVPHMYQRWSCRPTDMQMMPGVMAAPQPVMGKGRHKGWGEKGKTADQRGRTYSEVAHLHWALLPGASRGRSDFGGCCRAQQHPTLPPNAALRFLGSAEMAHGSLPGPIVAGAHENQQRL